MSRELTPRSRTSSRAARRRRDDRLASAEFRRLLALVQRAVAARVSLVQLREKSLSARTLLRAGRAPPRDSRAGARRASLVNDRADIARAAGCDGVHLTTRSLEAAPCAAPSAKTF